MTKLLDTLSNRKLVYAICLLVIVSTAFEIYRREMIDWVAPQSQLNLLSNVHMLMMMAPLLLPPTAYFMLYSAKYKCRPINWFFEQTDRMADYRWLTLVFYAGIVGSLIAWPLIPAIIGTWTTISALLAGILLLWTLMRGGRIPTSLSLVLAISLVGLWVGLWEVPYQWAYKLTYDLPQVGAVQAWKWVAYETVIELPSIGAGVFVALSVNAEYKIVKAGWWFWFTASMYVVFMAWWLLEGFWTDVHYNWGTLKWEQTAHFDKWAMFIYKASKVWLMLALAGLIKTGGNEVESESNKVSKESAGSESVEAVRHHSGVDGTEHRKHDVSGV